MNLLDGLNESQRRAVAHEGGPLLVLAGPGTGKTRVIIHRIARLVLEARVKPESVVAVTFTVKAAAQMRDRLAELLAPMGAASLAQRVHVHTFHGLGWQIVQRYRDVLGLPARLDLMDTAQQRRLVRGLIIEHRLLPDSAGMGADAQAQEAEAVFEVLWNQGVTPQSAEEIARRWSAQLKANVDKMGDDELKAQRFKARRFEQVAALYRLFDESCRRMGLCSFGDLILAPIRILRQESRAQAIVHDDYRHWVVDEFQDVNTAQIELLRLLAPPTRDGLDLCVVGDDDQSIYGFRGADDRAFARFVDTWKNATEVQLAENYRSQQPVIDVANAVIGGAHERFAPDKVIRRGTHVDEPDAGVQYIRLEDDKRDGDAIALLILTDRAAHPERPWSSYAVIARTNASLDQIEAALQLEGVPTQQRRTATWREDEGVRDVLAWARLLSAPHEHWLARRLMIRPPAALELRTISRWEQAYQSARTRWQAGETDAKDPGAYLAWINGSLQSGGLEGDQRHRTVARRMLDIETELHSLLAGKRADEVLFAIIRRIDAAHGELLPLRDRAARISSLVGLFRLARNKQPRLEEPGDLDAFLRYFDDLSDKDDGVDLSEMVESSAPSESEPAGGDTPGGGVQLLTAHTAKGLEFDTVFVPRVSPSRGYPTVKARAGAEVPPEIWQDRQETRDNQQRMEDEERRLFYVACTRAERRLVLLAKWNKSASKSLHFIDELVRDPADPKLKGLIATIDAGEVMQNASALGIGNLSRGAERDELTRDAGAAATLGDRQDRLILARQRARLDAALALDAADQPDLSDARGAIGDIARRLRNAAIDLAVASHIDRTGLVPAWLASMGEPETLARAEQLAETCRSAGAGDEAASADDLNRAVFKPLKAPLELSFTRIDQYLRCPRCYYLEYVMGIRREQGEPQVLGQVVHDSMQEFFKLWSAADNDGSPLPTISDLIRTGRTRYFAALGKDQKADPSELRRVEEQLKTALTQLHDPDSHILELEQKHVFPYVVNGVEHQLTAKLDRLDLLGTGAYRIIDYKTGEPLKKYTAPEPSDLQMGIYALAIDHDLGNGTQVKGSAEYWLLSSGARGTLDLEKLNRKKIRGVIDGVISGMLAGNFAPKKSCEGVCRLFGTP